jgi:hypothetical protein
MKKQILFTGVIISAILFSCSKENVERQQTTPDQPAQNSTISNSSSERTVVDPLTLGLDGWFGFNGNLKDLTKKLPDGVATSRTGAVYTYDRNGIYNGAIKFNGSYGVKLSKVPQQTHGSIAAWVQYDPTLFLGRFIATPKATGIGLSKKYDEVWGSVQAPNFGSMGIYATSINSSWHHFVVTFDDLYIRLYKDGLLVKSQLCGASYSPFLEEYYIGYLLDEFFVGSLDDLRFYSRTLSASDVAALYNL